MVPLKAAKLLFSPTDKVCFAVRPRSMCLSARKKKLNGTRRLFFLTFFEQRHSRCFIHSYLNKLCYYLLSNATSGVLQECIA